MAEDTEQPEEIESPREMAICDRCKEEKRAVTIVDGVCSDCRTVEARPEQPESLIDWPEVRQRRLIMMVNSDHTQLADRDPEMRERFTEWRQQLRDVTDAATPALAWEALDQLESTRPNG